MRHIWKGSFHKLFVCPTSWNCHFKREVTPPYSHLHQCFSFSFPYLFISPLFHLSSYFHLNFFPFFLFPPLPFITVLCDAYLVAVSHPLFHWEKSKASKHGVVGAVFLCVCSFGHIQSSTVAVTITPNFLSHWANSTGIVKL